MVDYATTLTWPVAPDEVVAARCDEGYLDVLCRRTGAVEHEVTVDGLRTVVRRLMPTHRFPDFARRLTGDRITLLETTTWSAAADRDGRRTALVELRIEGAPVTAQARVALVHIETGAHESIDGEVTAKVPLVGGKIEKAVVPALVAAIDAQVDAYRQWTST